MNWIPNRDYVGLFLPGDGSIDFYLRVASLASEGSTCLDLGAGRGEWFEDDPSEIRRKVRDLRTSFTRVAGADVDQAVFQNRAIHDAGLIVDGRLPFESSTFDVIVCDWVLEHIEDVDKFVSEVDRVLKPGGWFCARTPHKFSYVSISARLLPSRLGDFVLKRAQPVRKEEDVFPKFFRLNTIGEIGRRFSGYERYCFVRRMNPAYFFGSRSIYRLQSFIHHLMPNFFSGIMYVFLRKK